MPNSLQHESSPYLLQHANNPVNWYAWNDDTLALARKENKLILVSIGYSACHWCHVMEHESFEDAAVAEIMNRDFINIKVDREERPDIDMVYMGAVQIMTGQGGWPLNCFALPDGRPVYGGTYFPKQQWLNVLQNLAALFKENPDKAYEYAGNLVNGLEQLEIPKAQTEEAFDRSTLQRSVQKWKQAFDAEHGGPNRAPKFPLPNNYLFLLNYSHYEHDAAVKKHLDLTLAKMARGGIYDQLGGGFARYSTDIYWKVPHFEKMLYDNAQLVSLYAQAYKQSPQELYKQTVYETIAFVERELCSPDWGFYSALDADSEGMEGKYYVWEKEELENLLGEDFSLFADYYQVNETGYWEDGYYILMRDADDASVALKYHISVEELRAKINAARSALLAVREQRVRPGLDHKILAAWNGLMCKALGETYLVFGEERFKTLALKNAQYLQQEYCLADGKLLRVKNKSTVISGFLDDYAFTADAFMTVYLITADESWLLQARSLCDYALSAFYSEKDRTFFYTDASEEKLIVRKAEWSDNVIPSSASQMALNLRRLSVYFEEPNYLSVAEKLLRSVLAEIAQYGPGYSNWGILLLELLQPPTELVIVGNNVNENLAALYKQTSPNVIFAVSDKPSDLPLVRNRYVHDSTLMYVCKNHSCLLPTPSVEEALRQLEDH